MARQQNTFEKLRREMEKKRNKQEKLERKRLKKQQANEPPEPAPVIDEEEDTGPSE